MNSEGYVNYVNGEILEILLKKVKNKQAQKRIRSSERDMYEFFELIVLFLKTDHAKTQQMYTVYRPVLWGLAIAAGTFITLIVSGKIEIVIK